MSDPARRSSSEAVVESVPETLGALIRRAREAKGMPTEALAVEVYRSAEVVRRWERDANTPPSTVIGRLAEVLDVSADQLHELARAGR